MANVFIYHNYSLIFFCGRGRNNSLHIQIFFQQSNAFTFMLCKAT